MHCFLQSDHWESLSGEPHKSRDVSEVKLEARHLSVKDVLAEGELIEDRHIYSFNVVKLCSKQINVV